MDVLKQMDALTMVSQDGQTNEKSLDSTHITAKVFIKLTDYAQTACLSVLIAF